ncbi:GTP 3',8-cyclase MoaA [Tuberibacillus sp. Marseille-P3662]|uniref:GTP 3',8-cyclase MoaA n=1 Tax=Tuberibacillus sp. Marseille-P3662 TaxID=1965358 RepID=UPI000A1CCCCA|nr:GTP 3',8-cyclase MoaA [Tuberibacillus sp. Marseille-P3662]
MAKHIQDLLGRPLRDLRISLTDRCNFRCTYCMPKEVFGPGYEFLSRSAILSNDEVVRLAGLFAEFGVKKIRLTGGEPLLRPKVDDLIHRLAEINGIEDLAMTTNGSLVPKKAHLLKSSGLRRVTISLDSLSDDRFAAINDQGFKASDVLEGIWAAKAAGLQVKINMMVQKGVNEDEVLEMLDYFRGSGIVVRFIEYMDVGNSNGWRRDDVFGKKAILESIKQKYDIEPIDADYFGEVASRYRLHGSDDEFGVISSVTDAFCSSCTRARLSADGSIFTCLFASKGVSFRNPMRNGASDQELSDMIQEIWGKRHDRYSEERKHRESSAKNKIEMSYIGG